MGVFFAESPIKNEKDLLFGCWSNCVRFLTLLNANSPTPIYTCVTVFVTKERNTCLHLKEALFNIVTKTMIFVEKNVITCNIAVTNMKVSIMTRHFERKGVFSKGILFLLQIRVFLSPVGLFTRSCLFVLFNAALHFH